MNSPVVSRWVILAFAALLGLAGVFWRELRALAADGVTANLSRVDQQTVLRSDDPRSLAAYYFEPETAEGAYSGDLVSDVRLESKASNVATVVLRLSSATPPTEGGYPTLTVGIYNKDGGLLRTVDITSDRYQHGPAMGDEYVRLAVPIQPTDAQFKVNPRRLRIYELPGGTS